MLVYSVIQLTSQQAAGSCPFYLVKGAFGSIGASLLTYFPR